MSATQKLARARAEMALCRALCRLAAPSVEECSPPSACLPERALVRSSQRPRPSASRETRWRARCSLVLAEQPP